MDGLTNTNHLYKIDKETDSRVVHPYGHPQAVSWRDDETIVVAENKQLSQFYIPTGGDTVLMNHVNVATSNISALTCFASNGDVVVCTESDRGVFLLSARELRIVKRWRAPIRSTVVKCVGERCEGVGEGGAVHRISVWR